MMTKEQMDVSNFVSKYSMNTNLTVSILDIISEFGEFSKAILNASDYGQTQLEITDDIKEEFADFTYSYFKLANNLGFDVGELCQHALSKYEERFRKKNKISSD